MRYTIVLLSSITAAFAASTKVKRAICTVKSLDNPLLDDVPAITEALNQCGDTGRVLFPAKQTFNIRSPVDLGPCRICDFQIDGVLSVSSDWSFWTKQTAVFKISKSSNVVIHSNGHTGTIDANNYGWTGDGDLPKRVPVLFSINQGSSQIYIRDLHLKNAPGNAFHVSNSSAVRFQGVSFQSPAATGYLVEQAQHVYVWNNTIQATRSCVSILPNSSNVQVEESTCITLGEDTAQAGIELKFGAGTALDWIRNIFVKKVRAVGSMNVVSFLAGSEAGKPHPVEIYNTTFTNITIEGPATMAVNIKEGTNTLTATDVMFRGFGGEAQKESDLECTSSADVCELTTEDWNVVISQ
jgi:hypothetical protein